MLKQRILTALVLIPLVVWAIFWTEAQVFELLIGIVFLLGAWEWARISGLASSAQQFAYVLLVAVGIGSLWYLTNANQYRVLPGFLIGVFCWWLLALVWVVRFTGADADHSGLRVARSLLAGLFVLVAPFYALMVLRTNSHYGPDYVMFVLLLIWIADSGAFFVGKQFGRHKLAPIVSPGKSWEGVVGALIGSVIAAIGAVLVFDIKTPELWFFIAICLVTVLFSIVGDLFESLVKRISGVKDSGKLLPGHGGVMDRIDSLTAAAPVFLLGIWVTGI